MKNKYNNEFPLDFSLPSELWDISEIKLNFTDIRYQREIFEVEAEIGPQHVKPLGKNAPKGYAVQINITEPTEIYAAHIYGDETVAATTNITIQINGYESVSNQPNDTIYGSTLLSMTNQTKWHIQLFPAPILLQKGYYYLVVNGTEMTGPPPDPGKYYWVFNDINPQNPNLYTWEHDGDFWVNNNTGDPFLYKLDQKVISEFFPNEINLTAEIGEQCMGDL